MRRIARPKPVVYELIDRDGAYSQMYALLDSLVSSHHDELVDAKIALAWCTSWKPDVDGRVTLGKCKKASDLDRELSEWDFIILLRRQFWLDTLVKDEQRKALLDHELCHATVKMDKFLEPVVDARGRKIWRVRKHDIEEFGCIVERYGCYKRDLEQFAASLSRAPKQPVMKLKPSKAAKGDESIATTH